MRKMKEEIQLECMLTNEEKLNYSKELAEAVSARTRAEENLKSVQTQIKAEITACDGKINGLANKIETGKEYRFVECEILYDFKKKTKKWKRSDTGQIAKACFIPEGELQEEMV